MFHLFDSISDGSDVNIVVAFLAGLAAFFASCLLPLVPTYLAYLSGITLLPGAAIKERGRLIKLATVFVVGFILAFLIIGLSLRSLSILLFQYKELIQALTGILFIILGLFVLGVFQSAILSTERKLSVNKLLAGLKKHAYWHALLFGFLFGLGWSPCVGPVLAVILYWSSQVGSQIYGTLLLFVFGLGLGLPFIVIAAGFEQILPWLHKYKKISLYMSWITGTLILLVGLVLLTTLMFPSLRYLLGFIPSYL